MCEEQPWVSRPRGTNRYFMFLLLVILLKRQTAMIESADLFVSSALQSDMLVSSVQRSLAHNPLMLVLSW